MQHTSGFIPGRGRQGTYRYVLWQLKLEKWMNRPN